MLEKQKTDPEQNADASLHRYAFPARYEIENVIGKGATGIVLRANDKVLGRKVAIKLLVMEGNSNATVRERFLREGKILASLSHPNIVGIHSSGVTESGDLYHVTEIVDGKSLAESIKQSGAFSLRRFVDLFRQVLEGLAHAHQHNIIHRDLKPSNIMLCQEGDRLIPKIVDFGIARVNETGGNNPCTLTRVEALLGSPAYMSPEQCRGAKVDQLSDIYSLACVMHECLLGKAPFQGETTLELMYKHMNQSAPMLESFASDQKCKRIGNLIDRCLRKNPEERPQSCQQIIAEMDAISPPGLDTGNASFCKTQEISARKWALILLPLALLLVAASVAFKDRLFNNNSKISSMSSTNFQIADKKDKLKDQIERCQKLRDSLATARDSQAKELKTTELIEALILLSKLQQSHDAACAEETLNEALNLCSIDTFRVQLLAERADCRNLLGKLGESEADYRDSAQLASKTFGVGTWNHLMLLQKLILFCVEHDKFAAAEKTLDELVSVWKYDLWWEHASDPIDLRCCQVIDRLLSSKSDKPQDLLVKLRMINKCAETLLLHQHGDKRAVRETGQQLKQTSYTLIPGLPAGEESRHLCNQLKNLLAAYGEK